LPTNNPSPSNQVGRTTNRQTSPSFDKLDDFWKPIILVARKEREFFRLLDYKLKPIILDKSQTIEKTVGAINLFVVHVVANKERLVPVPVEQQPKLTGGTVPVTPDGVFETRLREQINKEDYPVMDHHHGIDCCDVQTVHGLLRERTQ
jgi:hypothetical protein